jgi:hypothetical protein
LPGPASNTGKSAAENGNGRKGPAQRWAAAASAIHEAMIAQSELAGARRCVLAEVMK